MIDVVQWRVCIGSWDSTKCSSLGKSSATAATIGTSLDKRLSSQPLPLLNLLAIAGLLIAALMRLVLLAGDVEINPGPTKGKCF